MSSSESEAEENPYDQGDERVKFSKLFVLQKVLGKGAFGIVVSAIMKANLKEYAVKVFIHFLKQISESLHIDYPKEHSGSCSIRSFHERS